MELQQFITVPFIFTFLLFLLMLVKHRKKSNIHYPKSRLPPGPSKLPVMGHLHHMRGLPHHVLKDLAKIHGPLMFLQFGQFPVLVVSSPDTAKQITKTHDLKFIDRASSLASKTFSYGCKDIALSPYGEYWRQARKISILECFSARRVQSFWSIREEEVSNLITKISMKAGSPVNLSQEGFKLICDITFRVAFGQKCKHKDRFIPLVKRVIGLASAFSIQDIFPSLKFLDEISGLKSKLDNIFQETDKMMDIIIKEHQEHQKIQNNENLLEGGILDALLVMREDEETKVPITIENVKAILIDLFVAGVDSTSATLEWTLSELLRCPRVMKEAQAEVRQILKGKEAIDQEDMNKLNYLGLIVKETLRLHPPAPFLVPRECRESCEVEGYEIPKGTKVLVNAWAIGRDPKHWRDPETFKPERFEGEQIDYNGTNSKYIPFGAGRRMCPGIMFGTASLELALAELLYHFDWTVANGIKPEQLDMTEEIRVAIGRKTDLYAVPKVYQQNIQG